MNCDILGTTADHSRILQQFCIHLAAFMMFSHLRRGVKRFIADVQKMEKRFGTKILCPERLKMLDRKANH